MRWYIGRLLVSDADMPNSASYASSFDRAYSSKFDQQRSISRQILSVSAAPLVSRIPNSVKDDRHHREIFLYKQGRSNSRIRATSPPTRPDSLSQKDPPNRPTHRKHHRLVARLSECLERTEPRKRGTDQRKTPPRVKFPQRED